MDTAIAVTSTRAVQQLLWRKSQSLAGSLVVVDFSRGSSSEGPAGTAALLVEDCRNIFPVVNFGRSCEAIKELVLLGSLDHSGIDLVLVTEVFGGELFISKVGELVQTHFPGVGWVRVMGSDGLESLVENSKSVGLLGRAGVNLSLGEQPILVGKTGLEGCQGAGGLGVLGSLVEGYYCKSSCQSDNELIHYMKLLLIWAGSI